MMRWITVALSAGLLTACSPAAEESPTPTPEPTRSISPMPTPEQPESPIESPSPEPSPTFSESYPPPDPDETEEQRSIREGWEAYNEVRDKYDKDPNLNDWTETQYVTTGTEAQQIIESISAFRELNLKIVGDMVYRDIAIGEPTMGEDGVSVAIVSACFDPSYRYPVDIDTGEPSEERLLFTLRETVTMERGADGVWRAAVYRNAREEC